MENDDEGDQNTMAIQSTYDVEKQLDKMIQLGQLRKNIENFSDSRSVGAVLEGAVAQSRSHQT